MSSVQSTTLAPPIAAPAVSPRRARTGAGFLSRWFRRAYPWILPAAILALWQIAVSSQWIPPILLPAPSRVLNSALDMFAEGLLLTDFFTSLKIVLHGFAWGAVLGLGLGVYAGLSRVVERVMGPTLDAIRQVPPLAMIPFVILWAGVGDLAKLIVISKAVFFPIFLNTLQGIRSIQREHIEVGRVLRLSRWQLVRHIYLPGALPSILVGIRYGAGLSWALVVAAELISGHAGLGYLIQRSQDLLFTDQMFVAIIIIASFGLILDRSLKALERHLLRWKPGFIN